MANTNDKQEQTKQQIKTGSATDPGNLPEQKISKSVDTAPDEFIGTEADTDLPVEGEVVNDAVLRGENAPEEVVKEKERGMDKKKKDV